MALCVRAKRVLGPLNDEVKASIVGINSNDNFRYGSSGSEHDECPCLSHLVHDYFLEDDDRAVHDGRTELVDRDEDVARFDFSDRVDDPVKAVRNILNPWILVPDEYKKLLVLQVMKAVNIYSGLRSTNRTMFLRNVMYLLRNCGHDAAVCKAQWESCGALTGGRYDFIDVVIGNKTQRSASAPTRYIIDLDFASQFSIARPTRNYTDLLNLLPNVFIGREEDLKKVVKIVSFAAKTSLKSNELMLPPWRKNRYMQMKWFGPHRRTVNLIPTNSSLKAPAIGKPTVKCRSVGFEPTSGGTGSFVVRTR